MTCKAVCPTSEATPEQKQAVALTLTRQMVDAYATTDLSSCIDAAGRLEALVGEYKLAQLYLKLAERHLNDSDDEPLDGLITLSEK